MTRSLWILIPAMPWMGSVNAASVEARCDIYPGGSDHLEKMIACRFYRRRDPW